MLGDKMSFWYLLVLAHKEERIQRKNSMNKQREEKDLLRKTNFGL